MKTLFNSNHSNYEWESVFEEKYVRVRGKGDKERLVPLTETTIKALQTHLERMLPRSPEIKKVFLNQHGYPITTRGVQMVFDRICGAANLIKKGLSPHKLRHTCLTLLYSEGVDLMTLKELAGHDDIGSTEIYAHVDMGDVRKAVEKTPSGVDFLERDHTPEMLYIRGEGARLDMKSVEEIKQKIREDKV